MPLWEFFIFLFYFFGGRGRGITMNGKLWKLVAYMKCKNWSTMILLAKKAQIDEKGSTKCWIIGRKLRLAF